MGKSTAYLAFDFGASSGRLMLAVYDGEKLSLEQIHRFPNEPVWMNGHFYWDFPRLFHEMKQGLKKAARLDHRDCRNRNRYLGRRLRISGRRRAPDLQSVLLPGSQECRSDGGDGSEVEL